MLDCGVTDNLTLKRDKWRSRSHKSAIDGLGKALMMMI